MHVEQKSLEQKNNDLAGAFREKAKNQQQLQKLYQSLKQQQLATGMELAADHDAEHVLHAAGLGHRNDRHMQSRAGSNGSGGSGGHNRTVHPWEQMQQGSRGGLQTARTLNPSLEYRYVADPLHRQRTYPCDTIRSPRTPATIRCQRYSHGQDACSRQC